LRLHLLEHDALDIPGTNIDRWARARGHTVARTYVCSGGPLPDPADLDWLMVMGGSPHAYDETSNPWLPAEKAFVAEALERGIPTLGVCFGAQVLAEALGGSIFPAEHGEIGWHEVRLTPEGRRSDLFRDVPDAFETFHWHVDQFSLPPGCSRLAASRATPNQAFLCTERPVAGFQFHPEYTIELVDYFAREHSETWVPDAYVSGGDAVLARNRTMRDTYWLMEAILDNLVRQFRRLP
jgi:GMP synthase-like glutamine amidotransferase